MCDVPNIAVFCSESIECFPGSTASKFFLKLLVTIPVAPIITGTIVHFKFHIRCISIHKLMYFNFFSASFCTIFLSAGIATSISVHVFSLLFLIIISIIITFKKCISFEMLLCHYLNISVRSTLPILSFRAHTSSNTIRSANYFGKASSFYATKIIRLLNVQTLSQLMCTMAADLPLSRPGQDFYSR